MNAGEAHQSGNNNIVIGYSAVLSSTTSSNEVVIGNTDITRFRIPGIGLDLTSAPLANIVEDTSPQLGGDLDTNSHHILLDDDHELKLGGSTDFQIWHSSNNTSYIKNSTGELKIASDNIALMTTDQSEKFIDCNGNGNVELYYNNENKLSTELNGAATRNDNSTSVSHRFTTNGGTARGYVYANSNNEIGFLDNNGSWSLQVAAAGGTTISYNHLNPSTNNSKDLGTSSTRWRNIYTNDLNLSNEGGKNEVDGTWGNYTIQEGESDLFLINKRNGKKYKFNLTEVS